MSTVIDQSNLEPPAIVDDLDKDCWGLSDGPPDNLDELLKIPDSELGLSKEMLAELEILANSGDVQSPPQAS